MAIISGGASAVGMGVMGTMAGDNIVGASMDETVGAVDADNADDGEGDEGEGASTDVDATVGVDSPDLLSNNFDSQSCLSRKFTNMAKTIDDVEDLELGVPVNIAFDNRQRKR